MSVSDPELQEGRVVVNDFGLPLPCAGAFANVYQVRCPATGNNWAVKCFTREVRGLGERYRQISAHLQQAWLPFLVDFEYVEEGIRVRGQWYPFLKMRWVEGVNLNQFVGERLADTATLERLADMWVRLAVRLRATQTAHGDLQHGNVLLAQPPGTDRLSLKLIDYDGMHVPALAGRPSVEVGHPAFQHPRRLSEGIHNAEIDRFSHLAIYCALRCLQVNPELWSRYDTGENLLFRRDDFAKLGESALFRELWWGLPDPNVRALVGHLVLATQTTMDRTPLLEELVFGEQVRPLSLAEERQVDTLLDGAKRPAGASVFRRKMAGRAGLDGRVRARPGGVRRDTGAPFGRYLAAGLPHGSHRT